MFGKLEEYDAIKLRQARKLIREVCDYYYGITKYKKIWSPLETVLKKIDKVLAEE